MPKFDPRPCAKCKKPFTPKGPASKYCDACPRASKTSGARKPPTATKSSPKPATRPTVARNGSLDARVQSMLDDAKARVTALRAELADTERRVALLTELVG